MITPVCGHFIYSTTPQSVIMYKRIAQSAFITIAWVLLAVMLNNPTWAQVTEPRAFAAYGIIWIIAYYIIRISFALVFLGGLIHKYGKTLPAQYVGGILVIGGIISFIASLYYQ